MRPSGTAHIVLDDRGRGWIEGKNVKVIEVALDMLSYAWTAEQIYEGHDHYLSLAEIHAALSYYYDHQAEYDAEIDRITKEYEAAWAANRNSPLHQKLRALGKIP